MSTKVSLELVCVGVSRFKLNEQNGDEITPRELIFTDSSCSTNGCNVSLSGNRWMRWEGRGRFGTAKIDSIVIFRVLPSTGKLVVTQANSNECTRSQQKHNEIVNFGEMI